MHKLSWPNALLNFIRWTKRRLFSFSASSPRDDAQHTAWMTMGDSLYDAESVDEMKSLEALGDRLPHDLARAVLLVPDKLRNMSLMHLLPFKTHTAITPCKCKRSAGANTLSS